ncbi:two-component sensor histidine kinase [Natronosporangium hydrolyticum]|uniref:histidine kinase n=1 Tax=Natronosporangium hydrolyticum TaxID=2811111 RepID=A0A895YLR8_9ACTN|nr:histidine kinase [Natronosporangium hydrolyticum]QSB15626.1 two-component sensor histidine kinase [Natronosporangium hydrolyticum]
MTGRRVPRWVVDLVVLSVAAADAWARVWQLSPLYEVVDGGWLYEHGEPGVYHVSEIVAEHGLWWGLYFDDRVLLSLLALGVVVLPARRRWPLAVFLVTLPPLVWLSQTAATLIALYTLASLSRQRLLLGACALLLAVHSTWVWGAGWEEQVDQLTAIWFGQGLVQAAAAVFLGQLVQVRRDLSQKLVEISQARDHEQWLVTQRALAAERAQLAREMHDVVSHQVSLIAVQAGALQVHTRDPEASQAGRTIRELSVQTLNELRHMVTVLREPGGGGKGGGDQRGVLELAPQPTLAELAPLVAGGGVDARLELGELPEVDPPTARAIYRTVQEALTNVRKHAPGATATVRVALVDGVIRVEIVNTPATRPVVPLPGSGQGLRGLAQRAELVGGSLDHGPTADGGWRVRATLPAASRPASPAAAPVHQPSRST